MKTNRLWYNICYISAILGTATAREMFLWKDSFITWKYISSCWNKFWIEAELIRSLWKTFFHSRYGFPSMTVIRDFCISTAHCAAHSSKLFNVLQWHDSSCLNLFLLCNFLIIKYFGQPFKLKVSMLLTAFLHGNFQGGNFHFDRWYLMNVTIFLSNHLKPFTEFALAS